MILFIFGKCNIINGYISNEKPDFSVYNSNNNICTCCAHVSLVTRRTTGSASAVYDIALLSVDAVSACLIAVESKSPVCAHCGNTINHRLS